MIEAPIINTTNAQTTIAAADGQTVVIGGLIAKAKEIDDRKIPFLGDIPVLQWAFRTRFKTAQKRELMIILTPHIVYSQWDADRIKIAEARRMDWILADVDAVHGDIGVPTEPDSDDACPPDCQKLHNHRRSVREGGLWDSKKDEPSPRLEDRQGGEYLEPSAPPASIIVPEEDDPIEPTSAVVPIALTVEPAAPTLRPLAGSISLPPSGATPITGPRLGVRTAMIEQPTNSRAARVPGPGAPPVLPPRFVNPMNPSRQKSSTASRAAGQVTGGVESATPIPAPGIGTVAAPIATIPIARPDSKPTIVDNPAPRRGVIEMLRKSWSKARRKK